MRKGAKGIAILAPMIFKKKADDKEAEDEQTRVFGFRTAYERLSRDLRPRFCVPV